MVIVLDSDLAVCAGCDSRFNIVRSGEVEEKDLHKETSVLANVTPAIESIGQLMYRAKGYAHLEFLYEVIRMPFDSTLMDRLLMGLGFNEYDEPTWFLTFLSLRIRDFSELKKSIKGGS